MLELHMVPTSGDATLLRFLEGDDEVNILVDGGNRKSDCVKYLKNLGVKRLHLMIVSHLDLDHTRGLQRVTDEIPVDEAWITDIRPLIEAAAESVYIMCCVVGEAYAVAGKPVKGKRAVYEGYERQLGPFYLQVLSPPRSLHHYIRQPGTVTRILKAREGQAIRSHVRTLVEEAVEGLGRDSREQIYEVDRRVSEVIDRFDLEVPQEDEIRARIDMDDLDPEYWREVDDFYVPAKRLFNDISIVVRVTYRHGGTTKKFLFPGDLTNWTIMLARHARSIRQCVLKAPHHGSAIEYDPEDCAAFWLHRQATRYKGRFRYAWQEIVEEYLYMLRESLGWPRRRVPFLFPEWLMGPPWIEPDSEGIYTWLSPERSLVYPRKSSKSLPKLGVRNAIVNASEAMSCTLSQTTADSRQHAPSEACVDCYRCAERSAPIILEW